MIYQKLIEKATEMRTLSSYLLDEKQQESVIAHCKSLELGEPAKIIMNAILCIPIISRTLQLDEKIDHPKTQFEAYFSAAYTTAEDGSTVFSSAIIDALQQSEDSTSFKNLLTWAHTLINPATQSYSLKAVSGQHREDTSALSKITDLQNLIPAINEKISAGAAKTAQLRWGPEAGAGAAAELTTPVNC